MQTGRIVRFQENSCRKGTQRGKAATKRVLTEEGNKENEERPKPRRFWQKNAGRKILAKMSEIDRQQCKDRKERNLQPLFSAKLGHAQLPLQGLVTPRPGHAPVFLRANLDTTTIEGTSPSLLTLPARRGERVCKGAWWLCRDSPRANSTICDLLRPVAEFRWHSNGAAT